MDITVVKKNTQYFKNELILDKLKLETRQTLRSEKLVNFGHIGKIIRQFVIIVKCYFEPS
jgi:hypothetical protein